MEPSHVTLYSLSDYTVSSMKMSLVSTPRLFFNFVSFISTKAQAAAEAAPNYMQAVLGPDPV